MNQVPMMTMLAAVESRDDLPKDAQEGAMAFDNARFKMDQIAAWWMFRDGEWSHQSIQILSNPTPVQPWQHIADPRLVAATANYDLKDAWTPDCQGKQDYDISLLRVQTRYWPRNHVNVGDSPSASSYIEWHFGDDEFHPLCRSDFAGDTEQEVKQQVEKWANEESKKMLLILLEAGYGVDV